MLHIVPVRVPHPASTKIEGGAPIFRGFVLIPGDDGRDVTSLRTTHLNPETSTHIILLLRTFLGYCKPILSMLGRSLVKVDESELESGRMAMVGGVHARAGETR